MTNLMIRWMVIKMAAEEGCNGRPEIRFSNCKMAANTKKKKKFL